HCGESPGGCWVGRLAAGGAVEIDGLVGRELFHEAADRAGGRDGSVFERGDGFGKELARLFGVAVAEDLRGAQAVLGGDERGYFGRRVLGLRNGWDDLRGEGRDGEEDASESHARHATAERKWARMKRIKRIRQNEIDTVFLIRFISVYLCRQNAIISRMKAPYLFTAAMIAAASL